MKELTALGYAVRALREFKTRWERVPAYPKAKRDRFKKMTCTKRTERVADARRLIKKARAMGFRGSIYGALLAGEAIIIERKTT